MFFHALASLLSAACIPSAIVSCYNWILLYWTLTEDNLHRIRIVRDDLFLSTVKFTPVHLMFGIPLIGIAHDLLVHGQGKVLDDWVSTNIYRIAYLICFLVVAGPIRHFSTHTVFG